MRCTFVLTFLAAGMMAGCANQSLFNQPTPQQLGEARWNATRADLMLSLAKDQYANGNFDKCRETLDQAARMDPDNLAVHILTAKVCIEQGQFDVADDELTAARKIDPKAAEPDYLSGVIYQRWQQPDKALAYYSSAADKDPKELAYLMAKAETLVAMGRRNEALSILQAKVVYFEHSAAIRDAVGLLLVQQNQMDDAVEMFRRASILEPDDLTIREHLATALYQCGEYVDASDLLVELLKDPAEAKRADLCLTLSECDSGLQRYAEAREKAQDACDIDPSLTEAWLTLAKTSMQLNDQYRTRMAIAQALSIDPNNSGAYLLMGYLQFRQGNLQLALENFTHSASLNGNNPVSLCMIGYTYDRMNRHDEAEKYYQQAIKIDPKDPLTLHLMADAGGN
ncbi:MAG TPA: tetratricopeptide repeat protein [Tepidisphaeraceae bacterium]|nr:tetratricopeptide repeat protein [Tepidisphaeraceae bacterium]